MYHSYNHVWLVTWMDTSNSTCETEQAQSRCNKPPNLRVKMANLAYPPARMKVYLFICLYRQPSTLLYGSTVANINHRVRLMHQPPVLQYFSLILLQHQPPATSQVIVFFSHTIPTPAYRTSETSFVPRPRSRYVIMGKLPITATEFLVKADQKIKKNSSFKDLHNKPRMENRP